MHIPYEDRYRIISIDPGTHATGMSVLDFDLVNGTLYVPHSETYLRRDLLRDKPWMADVYGDREAAVEGYARVLSLLLQYWQPCAIVSESPFMGRFPQAFKALTESLTMFRTTVMNWDHTVPFDIIDPQSVKDTVGVPRKSKDKELMRAAVRVFPNLILGPGLDFDTLSEHAIDSIAVAIWKTKNI